MSATDNEILPQDELAALKARADMLGVTYHPSIGLDKLREKVNAAVTSKPEPDPKPDASGGAKEAVQESENARRIRKRREAAELVRIRVTCMNPIKKEWEGEIFTAGNSTVGTFKKYVPFNVDDGWHVERIIYNQIRDRQCQIFTTVKDSRGNKTRRGKMIREFAIEVLDPLTKEEIEELARRQAMSKSVD